MSAMYNNCKHVLVASAAAAFPSSLASCAGTALRALHRVLSSVACQG